MDNASDDRIRSLAQPLWESAARPYGMAMDFWLMAEQMVLEMAAASARIQSKAINPPPPPALGQLPDAAPVARVRELAECMWESAGRQYGMAQEFWLSAERHVLAMFRASTFPAAPVAPTWMAELTNLPAAAYLEQIRLMAYRSWEAAGRNYGQTLDYWLQAEREILNAMAAATERDTPPLGTAAVLSPASGVASDTQTPPDSATSPGLPSALSTLAPVSTPPVPPTETEAVKPAPSRPTAKPRRVTRSAAAKAARAPAEP